MRPLRCDDPPGLQPLAEQSDLQQQVRSIRNCQRSLSRLPHGDLRFYTTTLAMADADAVRAALGHERINLVGGSYGTRAALEYLRQFPRQVRRVVLDGVAPPDMVLPASFSADNQRALEAMLQGCEQEVACARRHPRLRQRWHDLLAQPAREVVALHPGSGLEERFRLDRAGIVQFVRGPLYVPGLASALPHVIEEAADGRFTPLVGLAASAQGSSRNLFLGMHFSVVCAEDYPRLVSAVQPRGADFGDAFAGRLSPGLRGLAARRGAARLLCHIRSTGAGAAAVRRAGPGDAAAAWRASGPGAGGHVLATWWCLTQVTAS